MEKSLHDGIVEVGCDEAGRGCLAGPVVAAAVILPPDFESDILNDSKKMTEKQRDILAPIIKEKALAYGIGVVSCKEIDEINILNASFLAMHRAIDQLNIVPQHILVDGNRFNSYKDIPHTTIVKGDSLYQSIAAASVLAKTYRDELMLSLHRELPQYGWDKSKGYPTKAHREAIEKHGLCDYHRKTFKVKPTQLKLDL